MFVCVEETFACGKRMYRVMSVQLPYSLLPACHILERNQSLSLLLYGSLVGGGAGSCFTQCSLERQVCSVRVDVV